MRAGCTWYRLDEPLASSPSLSEFRELPSAAQGQLWALLDEAVAANTTERVAAGRNLWWVGCPANAQTAAVLYAEEPPPRLVALHALLFAGDTLPPGAVDLAETRLRAWGTAEV